MGCFDRSPSDTADAVAGRTPDSGVALHDAGSLPGGVAETRDAAAPVVGCACASTLTIEGCRIVGVHGAVMLHATVDCAGGSFQWSTASAKVTLNGTVGSDVEVCAGAVPSAGRDQETVTVQWTGFDCSPLSRSVSLTVVNVVFSEAPAQSYGYDDMDTPASHLDDHVSVKRSASTVVHVAIQGGVTGNELDFVSLDAAKATVAAAPAQAAFDLTINGGSQDKAETNLVARARCPGNPEITRMFVDVYKEKIVRATIAKVWDSRHAGTTLSSPNLSVPDLQAVINPKAKAAVVRYELADHSATGGAVDIPYDNDGNGKLSWDITAGGGAEFTAIRNGFTASDIRIAIVHDLVSYYYLSAAAAVGDTTITLRGVSNNNFLLVGAGYPLGTGANSEQVVVQTVSRNSATVTLSAALTKAHPVNEPLEFNAAGWSSDPIIVAESGDTEAVIKRSVFHETGHRALTLTDLEALTNVMHFSRARTDQLRLRYKPENKKREAGTENQWETIPR